MPLRRFVAFAQVIGKLLIGFNQRPDSKLRLRRILQNALVVAAQFFKQGAPLSGFAHGDVQMVLVGAGLGQLQENISAPYRCSQINNHFHGAAPDHQTQVTQEQRSKQTEERSGKSGSHAAHGIPEALHQVAKKYAKVFIATKRQTTDEASDVFDGAEQADKSSQQTQPNQGAADESGHRHRSEQTAFGNLKFTAERFLVVVGDTVATAAKQVVDTRYRRLAIQRGPERLVQLFIAMLPRVGPAQFAADFPGCQQRKRQT